VNPYVDEEVMWQRLKDTQREAENRRLLGGMTMRDALRSLGVRAWLLAGLAMRRPPRRTWVDRDRASRRAA